jgi:hypothetical protein
VRAVAVATALAGLEIHRRCHSAAVGRAYADSARLPGFDEENVTAAGGFSVRETTQ